MHTMVENRSVVAKGGMMVTGYDKTFGGDGNVQYHVCDGSFMCIQVCHISLNCLLYAWEIIIQSYTSITL